MAGHRRVVAVGVLLGILAGCTHIVQPPAGVEQASVGVPPPGVQFTDRVQAMDGTVEMHRYTVLEDGEFRGRSVRRVASGARVILLDPATASYVALIENGELQDYSEPHRGTFAPPLWVGKRWTARRTSYDVRRGGRGYELRDDWEVEASETVTVPAGTFEAFRLRSSPGLNRDRVRRIWYAPEIALIVREEYEYLGQVSPDRRPRLIELFEYRPR